MRLPQSDELPFVGAGDRILVALAQETQVVGVLQLVDRAGIASELTKVKLQGADILIAAMLKLDLALALDGGDHRGSRDGQRDDGKSQHEQNRQQNVAALWFFLAAAPMSPMPADLREVECQLAVRGMVWRLLLSASSISTELLVMRMTR